jgi:hypothetical protein
MCLDRSYKYSTLAAIGGRLLTSPPRHRHDVSDQSGNAGMAAAVSMRVLLDDSRPIGSG